MTDRVILEKARQAAQPLNDANALRERQNNADMLVKLYALAEVAGADPAKALEQAQKGDVEQILQQYAQKAKEAIAGKKPQELNPTQLGAMADLLTYSGVPHPKGKSWLRPDEEEKTTKDTAQQEAERKRDLVHALNTIFDDDNEYKNLIRPYAFGGGGSYVGDGGKDTPAEKVLERVRNYDEQGKALAEAYEKPLSNTKPDTADQARGQVVEFVRRFSTMGAHEYSGNRGPLVLLTMGYEGDPYCGGGVNMVMDKVFGKTLFDQKTFRGAGSYRAIGAAYDALTDNPKAGDVVLFPSAYASSGYHVGIVSEVRADGRISYVDFNGGNVVSEKNNRNGAVYVDIEKLAKNKTGKTIQQLIADEHAPKQKAEIKIKGGESAEVSAPAATVGGAQKEPAAAGVAQ